LLNRPDFVPVERDPVAPTII